MNKVRVWYTTLWLSMVGLLLLLWSDVLGEDNRDETMQDIFRTSRDVNVRNIKLTPTPPSYVAAENQPSLNVSHS